MANDAKKAIENAGSTITEVKVEGNKNRFLLLKKDLELIDSVNLDEKAPPCLLPKYDSLLLGHKDRRRIIRDEYKPHVFKPKVGDIAATVLINGRIVGTWRQHKAKRMLTITVTPFERIGRQDLKEVEQTAGELGHHMGYEETKMTVAH